MSTALRIRRPVVRPSAPPSETLREYRFAAVRILLDGMSDLAGLPCESSQMRQASMNRLKAEALRHLATLEAQQ